MPVRYLKASLLTVAAIAADAALVLACHVFAQHLMFVTPYALWPGAAVLFGYAYLMAGGSVVLALIFIYEAWTET